MNSSRERKQSLGKTNISSRSESLNSARSNRSLDTARIRELNDPLYVHRPYTPEIKDLAIERRPALPKSRYPTIPHPDTVRVRRKPSVCPEEFLKKNKELTWFEAADFRSLLDDENKRTFAREFIERNRDRMWVYNRKYLNQDVNDICEDMIKCPHFMMDMVCYSRQEKALAIGMNSDKIYAAMDESKLSVPKSKLPSKDQFASTMTTSRTAREERISKLLLPATASNHPSIHRRGYKHNADFGNFSTWNGVLKNAGLLS